VLKDDRPRTIPGGDEEKYKEILRERVDNYPLLKLEVINSCALGKGHVININAMGLYGSHQPLREQLAPGSGYDGFTYFGSNPYAGEESGNPGEKETEKDQNGEVINDFIIPTRND
jgi:hypothetical protein